MANRFVLPGQFTVDTNGTPRAGAKLFFYLTGTSTPEDTYSDNALTTPNTNPVVADSAGVWGDIFLGAAVSYKVILKTSADVTVDTWDPVEGPTGAVAASQAETDARISNSKFVSPATIADGTGLQGASIASASALILPAVGDYFTVTGTTAITSISTRAAGRVIRLRFTAALVLTHNATTLINLSGVNATTAAGNIAEFTSEGSGNWRMTSYQDRNKAGLVYLGTFTGDATTIDLENAFGSFTKIRLVFENLAVATDTANIIMRVSQDNGSTYISSADHTMFRIHGNTSAATVNGNNITVGTSFSIFDSASNVAAETVSGEVEIDLNASAFKFTLNANGINSAGNFAYFQGGGGRAGSTVNAIRFLASSGGLAGTVRAYGYAL